MHLFICSSLRQQHETGSTHGLVHSDGYHALEISQSVPFSLFLYEHTWYFFTTTRSNRLLLLFFHDNQSNYVHSTSISDYIASGRVGMTDP